jgi:hypothetical protein
MSVDSDREALTAAPKLASNVELAENVAVWRAHSAIRDAHRVVTALTGVRGRVAAGAVVILLLVLGILTVQSPYRVLLLPVFIIFALSVLGVLILAFLRLTAAEASLYAMFEDVMRLEEERERMRRSRFHHD